MSAGATDVLGAIIAGGASTVAKSASVGRALSGVKVGVRELTVHNSSVEQFLVDLLRGEHALGRDAHLARVPVGAGHDARHGPVEIRVRTHQG